MGSAIKGRSREIEGKTEGGRKKASNRAMHEREECFHQDMGWLWVLSDIDHSARREVVYSTKSL